MCLWTCIYIQPKQPTLQNSQLHCVPFVLFWIPDILCDWFSCCGWQWRSLIRPTLLLVLLEGHSCAGDGDHLSKYIEKRKFSWQHIFTWLTGPGPNRTFKKMRLNSQLNWTLEIIPRTLWKLHAWWRDSWCHTTSLATEFFTLCKKHKQSMKNTVTLMNESVTRWCCSSATLHRHMSNILENSWGATSHVSTSHTTNHQLLLYCIYMRELLNS